MARPKKAKQRREPESIAHTLDEIESTGDRISQWISDNPAWILGVGLAIVLVAGGYALISASRESALEDASAALGSVQADFQRAMGASPDDIEVPEPANPETARRVREEYIERFQQVALDYPKTGAAALAGLQIGALEQALGRSDEALATWRATAEKVGSDDPIRALIELRVAAVYEADGRWVEAGEAFERAASVERFPLRHTARAEAARCYAEAGEVERALAAFAQVEADDPDGFRPEHLNARLLELQAAQRLQ